MSAITKSGKAQDGPSAGPAPTSYTNMGIPPGHLGNLDAQQQQAFDQLKADVEKELGPRDGTWLDDTTLVRFLRARHFSPPKALQMLKDSDAWRKSIDLEKIFANFDPDELHLARRHLPRWTGRRDRIGRPIYVYRLASIDKARLDEINAVPAERHILRLAVLGECMLRFTFPLLRDLTQKHQEKLAEDGVEYKYPPLCETTNIIDFEGCSLGQIWALRNHLKNASVNASNNYPETLGAMALANTPGFFNMVWTWIQRWFDEGSRNKMFVLGSNEDFQARAAKLTQIIAPENLPRAYGGEHEWQYTDEPDIDPEVQAAMGCKTMPKGPLVWEDGHMRILKGDSGEPLDGASQGNSEVKGDDAPGQDEATQTEDKAEDKAETKGESAPGQDEGTQTGDAAEGQPPEEHATKEA